MSSNFENKVMKSLEEITGRLSLIESKIDEATNFTNSVLGEGGVMPEDGLEAIKSTFASLLNPGAMQSDSAQEPQDIGGLVSSLKTFQDRLASVKDAMSDLSDDKASDEK